MEHDLPLSQMLMRGTEPREQTLGSEPDHDDGQDQHERGREGWIDLVAK